MNDRLRPGLLILALALLVTLAGCGAAPAEKEAAAAPPEAPAASADPAPAASADPAPADETIRVSSAGAFLNAVAPGAVIELAPGVYNLTEYLRGTSEHVSDYVARSFTDGWQAGIHDVAGLTIRGAGIGVTEIVAEPRYSDVLCFTGCSDVVIENVTFGHTIEQGNCQGAVLEFDDCRNVALRSLDLYGCGTYGVSANGVTGLTLDSCVIRECSYGIVDLSSCGDSVLKDCALRDNGGFDLLSLRNASVRFDGCTFTGNEGDSFLPSYTSSGSENSVRFENCVFGPWESESIREALPASEGFAFGEDCRFEGYSWSDITEPPDDPGSPESDLERIPLDTACLKPAAFDAEVLTAGEYFILYQLVDGKTGDVTFETSEDVRFLTFEQDGRGCFWTDGEKGRPFRYEMDSAYSCQVAFDDGGKAAFGLYADQGGALPRISEEGSLWLALSLDGGTLWFY